jgi:hypothetical protein
MERNIYYDDLKSKITKLIYVDISDFSLDMRAKLLVKMFEVAPIVDDSVPDYDRLEIVAKNILINGEIKNWFGRRIDTDLSKNNILTSVFNQYTQEHVLEDLINSVRNTFSLKYI